MKKPGSGVCNPQLMISQPFPMITNVWWMLWLNDKVSDYGFIIGKGAWVWWLVSNEKDDWCAVIRHICSQTIHKWISYHTYYSPLVFPDSRKASSFRTSFSLPRWVNVEFVHVLLTGGSKELLCRLQCQSIVLNNKPPWRGGDHSLRRVLKGSAPVLWY